MIDLPLKVDDVAVLVGAIMEVRTILETLTEPVGGLRLPSAQELTAEVAPVVREAAANPYWFGGWFDKPSMRNTMHP